MIIVVKQGEKTLETQSCTPDNKDTVINTIKGNMVLAGFSESELTYIELTDEQFNT